MYARVLSAQTDADGFEALARSAHRELPAARERPGFEGYLLMTDDDTGRALVISLWRTREQMDAVSQGTDAGVHPAGLPDSVLESLRLETYEVVVRA